MAYLSKNDFDQPDIKKPGDWTIVDDGAGVTFWIYLTDSDPQGNTLFARVPVTTEQKTEIRWHWNGDKEKPTISPSIYIRTKSDPNGNWIDLWHGWLRDGKLVTC